MTYVTTLLVYPGVFLTLSAVILHHSTANVTFHKILNLLYTKLHFLIHWQDHDGQTVTPIFKQHFPK